MRNHWLALVAFGGVTATVAFVPSGCSSNRILEEDAGPVECKDAGAGQGEGCDCDPNSKMWAQPRTCFEGPVTALKSGTACRSGKRACDPATGKQGKCEGQVLPEPETCDGTDQDCNGVIDDISSDEPIITDFTDAGLDPPIEAGAQCYVTGQTGLCSAGRYGCNAMGKKDCVAIVQQVDGGSPYTEVCNTFDDDCNGTVDDVDWLSQPCMVTYEDGGAPRGECAKGTRQCTKGVEVCQASPPAMTDTCDGKDNNCNGKYDESGCNNGTCPCAKGQWCCVYNNNVYCAGSSQYGNPYVCYQQP